jgi:hypothetical protein
MKEFSTNIKDKAPLLFSIKKEGNLKIPKGYFEELPNQLMNITSEKKATKIIVLKKWLLYSSAVAAIISLFFSLQNYNQKTEVYLAFNSSFNNLTLDSFENVFIDIENTLYIDFDDQSEIEIILNSLDSSVKEINLTNDDVNDFFESDIIYY